VKLQGFSFFYSFSYCEAFRRKASQSILKKHNEIASLSLAMTKKCPYAPRNAKVEKHPPNLSLLFTLSLLPVSITVVIVIIVVIITSSWDEEIQNQAQQPTASLLQARHRLPEYPSPS